MNERLAQIALKMLPGVGDRLAKTLVAYCGSASAVFSEKASALRRIPDIHESRVNSILKKVPWKKAESELQFLESHGIKSVFYSEPGFPERLKHCPDCPVLLFYRGEPHWNTRRTLAVVGTRSCTEYGQNQCRNFVRALAGKGVTVVSGLAYGIDIIAHREALANDIPTWAVLAHSLDRIYPSAHAHTARKMMEKGALITDYPSGTRPDAVNFPARNRIVAGLSDAVLVVEAAEKGGALITANIAHSYNRDVFALPGRLEDYFSAGCNRLIASQRAAIASSPEEMLFQLGWDEGGEEEDKEKVNDHIQTSLFAGLDEAEVKIANILAGTERLELENLCLRASMPASKVLPLLMNMEIKGVVRAYPGKVYGLVFPV